MAQPITIKMSFSSSSVGSVVLSQAVDGGTIWIDNANFATVNIVGIRKYSYDLNLVNWIVTDVAIDAGATPASVTIISIDNNTNKSKNSTINVDLTDDPNAIVTVVLSQVSLAIEYPTPSIWVKGPDDEQAQYEDPGQWYFDEDNNTLEIYIP